MMLNRTLLFIAVCSVFCISHIVCLQPQRRHQTPQKLNHGRTVNLDGSAAEKHFDDSRRIALMILGGTACLWARPRESWAAAAESQMLMNPPKETILVRGQVSLASNVEFQPVEGSALYITCRPDKPDNVPAAILNGSRGKTPPVLSAKLVNPTFPLTFQLSSPRDLTIEGASDGSTPSGTPVLDPDLFWWKNDNLLVSARWDNDGVAATRSADDLVGRGLWKSGDESDTVSVQLTGRGAFGKFATGGDKKQ